MNLDEVVKSNPNVALLRKLTQEIESMLVWKTKENCDESWKVGQPLGDPVASVLGEEFAKCLVKLYRVDGLVIFKEKEYSGYLMFQECIRGAIEYDKITQKLSVSQKSVNYDGELDIHLAHGSIFSAHDNYCKLEVKTYLEKISLTQSSTFEYGDTCLLDLFQNFVTTLNRINGKKVK